MPVDLYVGGVEHAVLHLLYSRFWHHVLYDLGLVSTKEPFKKLFNQGMIQGEDGQKMSKSRGNVINPDDVVKKYGADSFRMYEMFMGPLDKSKPWNTKGLQGCYRFLQKVWNLFVSKKKFIKNTCAKPETLNKLHKVIKKITNDIDNLRFNTSVSELMIFTNYLTTLDELDRDVLHNFLKLLNPFAPHISEELNQMIGFGKISSSEWPAYNSEYIFEENIVIAVQFNGKMRGTIEITNDVLKEDVLNQIKKDEKFKKYLNGMSIIKEIYIPKKIVNIVLK
jgi:leucyl-tRNA synthetase